MIPEMYKKIDIHTHIYPEKISDKAVDNLAAFYKFTVNSRGTIADLKKQCRECGVDGFLLLSVATNPGQVRSVNDYAASCVTSSVEEGFEAYGFACMHQDYSDMESEIKRAVSIGLRGVKIHPDIQGVDVTDRRLFPMYETCQSLDIPVYFHSGDYRAEYRFSEPGKISEILELFPRLRVAAAHLGGYKAWDEAVEYLSGNERVWYDTSSSLWSMSTRKADEIISKIGKDHLMFGSDYPGERLEDEIDRFMALDLTDKEREAVFYRNARVFLNVED